MFSEAAIVLLGGCAVLFVIGGGRFMICPYCENEMKLGAIEADNLLSWTPDGEHKKGATRWAISPHGVKLADYVMLVSASVEAYYCGNCNKIIIDVPVRK